MSVNTRRTLLVWTWGDEQDFARRMPPHHRIRYVDTVAQHRARGFSGEPVSERWLARFRAMVKTAATRRLRT